MATIVKLGEPKPPSRKDKPSRESSSASEPMDSGLLLKIGIGIGVALAIAAVCFFLFRGPAEEAATFGPGGGLPVPAGASGGSPGGAAAGVPVAGPAAASGIPSVAPGFQPAAAPPPGQPGEAIGGLPAGIPPPHVGTSGPAGYGSVTTTGGAARPAVTKKTQPAPNEDPYARENR